MEIITTLYDMKPIFLITFYQDPELRIEIHGSSGDKGLPSCRSSIEIPSGDRMNAMFPSLGGLFIVIPDCISFLQSIYIFFTLNAR